MFVDPTGYSWISDQIVDAWNNVKEAFQNMDMYPQANRAMQKYIQREFWRMGAQKYLRDMLGYETSAWLLEHSLQDNPDNVWRGNDSRIACLINNDDAYLSALDNAIRSANGNTINQNLAVSFNTGDLYYSIHNANIHIEGYVQDNGSWLIHTTMTDIYDFTVIQSVMSDGGDYSTQAGKGTIANDVAVVSQELGVINPYYITVDFYTTRRL